MTFGVSRFNDFGYQIDMMFLDEASANFSSWKSRSAERKSWPKSFGDFIPLVAYGRRNRVCRP